MAAGFVVIVVAPEFKARVVVGSRADRVVRYMRWWPLDRIESHCFSMGWTLEFPGNGG